MDFLKTKKTVIHTKFAIRTKFHFSSGKYIFPNSLINSNNLRLWNTSFNSSIDSKLWFLSVQNCYFWVLVFGYSSKLFPIHKEILGCLNVALNGLLNFSQFRKNFNFFKHKPRLYFQFFSQFTKELGYRGFWSTLDLIFCHIVRIVSQGR